MLLVWWRHACGCVCYVVFGWSDRCLQQSDQPVSCPQLTDSKALSCHTACTSSIHNKISSTFQQEHYFIKLPFSNIRFHILFITSYRNYVQIYAALCETLILIQADKKTVWNVISYVNSNNKNKFTLSYTDYKHEVNYTALKLYT